MRMPRNQRPARLRYYSQTDGNQTASAILHGSDTRVLPAYGFAEAAKYLRLPVPTLRSWSLSLGKASPVFITDDPERRFLSFMNLVEAHSGWHPP
jgi:hypothetical protein